MQTIVFITEYTVIIGF